MNRKRNAIIAGLAAGAAVFVAVFTWQYFRLLAQQPGIATHQPITSFPPSAAWLTALPWSLLAFSAMAVGAYLFCKRRTK